MISGRELHVVKVKTAQALGHRLEVQPVVDEAEVLLDLRVADVVPVTDVRVLESLEKKVPVGVDGDFLERLADLDAELDAAQARLLGDALEHFVGEVAVFGFLFLSLDLGGLAEFLVFRRVLFSGLEQIDELVGVISHVDLAHVQHDQLGPEPIRHFDGFHRVLVGVVALAGVGGGKLEDVRVGVVAPDGQRTEIVQRGDLDHAGLERLHDARHEAQPNSVA